MLLNKLTQIGLDKKEAEIYLALLEIGAAPISQISKKSGVKRTTVYDAIESLKKKGVVTVAKKGKRSTYFAEDPRMLGEHIDDSKETFINMLPELLSVANFIDKKPKIRFFEGVIGLKEVYRDTLNYQDRELLAWVPEETQTIFDKKFLNEQYHPKRIEKKIWMRAIAQSDPSMHEYKTLDSSSLRKTKLIPADAFPLDVEIILYGNRNIGIISFADQMGLIMESRGIFITLKSIFEAHWNSVQ